MVEGSGIKVPHSEGDVSRLSVEQLVRLFSREELSTVLGYIVAKTQAELSRIAKDSGVEIYSYASRKYLPDNLVELRESEPPYSVQEYRQIPNLVGVRAVFLFDDDAEQFAQLLPSWPNFRFENGVEPRRQIQFKLKDLASLDVADPRVRLTVHPSLQPLVTETLIELQIRTALQDVWSEIDHKLLYKPFAAALPADMSRHLNVLKRQVDALQQAIDEIRNAILPLPSASHEGENPRLASQGKAADEIGIDHGSEFEALDETNASLQRADERIELAIKDRRTSLSALSASEKNIERNLLETSRKLSKLIERAP